ncbi:Origin recognition complex subunit 1 [Trachymyrmex septentrionalis]|uniref:Origin recognition complex subunit 1 n=1 Tax=Trachymyrmex septentrionalis TaxID=34720 RepID=A0A195FXZ0_9HYME|nr:PREDICTED: origin recognition complex subunit 1 [Trachymyrmex septentrionalis]KYN45308.1 Origin recognition complex subunit 1 [Trachymyrmex septentrionalis]
MARFKKCTKKDISVLLETSSDSIVEESDKSYVPKKNTDNDSFDLSDSDSIFENNKLLLQTNALQKEQASLRLKLRRSTEQSMYKIDTESEDEKPKRLTRNTKRHLKSLHDENRMSHKNARIIKLPKRYSDYKCSSKSQVSVLQRDQINYNEKKLLLDSFDTINIRKKEINKHVVKSDDSDCNCIYFPKTSSTKSRSKLNKQNHICSIENINDNTAPKVHRTKSKYTFLSVDEELKKVVDKVSPNDKIYLETDARQNISFEDTPKTSRIQKSTRKSILNISNQYESIYKDENKTDKVEVIHKVGKNLSIKTNQRNEAIDSLVVQNDLSTPKISILKQSTLKPSMKMRADILIKPVTPLQEIRTKLHVSAVPKSLPCREEEFNNIYTFLESKLMDNSGGSIYINGVPGTGKTATVNEIVKCLKRSVEKGKLNRFDFVEINGMKLSEPRQAYVQILKQLSGKVVTWEQAYNMLEKKFNSNAKRPMTLLLVDELDLLCTKRQDVIYNLLDWPTKASARLVVITIANTMDLPERVLMGRVTSRLGLTRVTFEPYNYKQLYEIILIRLKNTDIFENEIIQLIARKVSAVSGDARRALDICRRVAEITETRNNTTVSVQDVNEALSEMIINPKVQAIKHCSKFEQIFLQAVCVEVKRIGVEEVCFMNVYRQFESLCSFDGYKIPNITQTLDICAKLGDYRLLICEYASNDIHKKILLNVSKDELHYALQKIDFD